MFRFLAKAGQHDSVARLLTANFVKPRLTQYKGPRGEGILVEMKLPKGVSKRQVDRMLFKAGVPGSRSRENKMRVHKWVDWYDAETTIGLDTPFILVKDGRFCGPHEIIEQTFCECCGPERFLRNLRTRDMKRV